MSTEGKPIKCKALVARAPKERMVEEEITVMPPKAGEVRVKVISNARELLALLVSPALNKQLFFSSVD